MSKITHEQIRNHFKDNFNANDVKYEDIRIITEYISQQEKQEKLLELYKRLAVEYMYLANYLNVANENKIREYQSKVFNIKEQIKELQNDKR